MMSRDPNEEAAALGAGFEFDGGPSIETVDVDERLTGPCSCVATQRYEL